MSPESAAMEYAGNLVSFVERPRMYCSSCGSRAEEHVFGPIRREVWCNMRTCVQYGKVINLFDRVITEKPHG